MEPDTLLQFLQESGLFIGMDCITAHCAVGDAALRRFHTGRGRRRDLDIAIVSFRSSRRLANPGHFQPLAGIEELVTCDGEAASPCPQNDPQRLRILQTLGKSLLVRYDISGNSADLEESVMCFREAIPSNSMDTTEGLPCRGESILAPPHEPMHRVDSEDSAGQVLDTLPQATQRQEPRLLPPLVPVIPCSMTSVSFC